MESRYSDLARPRLLTDDPICRPAQGAGFGYRPQRYLAALRTLGDRRGVEPRAVFMSLLPEFAIPSQCGRTHWLASEESNLVRSRYMGVRVPLRPTP